MAFTILEVHLKLYSKFKESRQSKKDNRMESCPKRYTKAPLLKLKSPVIPITPNNPHYLDAIPVIESAKPCP